MNEKDKIAFTGSHPDSLYRVVMSERELAWRARALRVLRWPAALLALCCALALLVYYVMPDSAIPGSSDGNGTVLRGSAESHFRTRPSIPEVEDNFLNSASKDVLTRFNSTGLKEVEFQKPEPDPAPVEEAKLPPAPTFPATVTPEVQYGNEGKTFPESSRVPKLTYTPSPEPDESTLKGLYRQNKGEFAIYVREEDVSTEHIAPENLHIKNGTVKILDAERDEPEDHEDYGILDTDYDFVEPSRDVAQHHDTNSTDTNTDSREDKNFTSGHSNQFGISIEEAQRLATTRNTYQARVSPTLPPVSRSPDKYSLSTTTWRSAGEDDLSCQSSQMELCRHLLPYDLVQSVPNLPFELNDTSTQQLIEEFSSFNGTGCSRRASAFLCLIMEPECTPSPQEAKKPCRKFCFDAVEHCSAPFPATSRVAALFNCQLYPESDCAMPAEPCFADELACGDGACVSASRRCDGVTDCPTLVDERGCHKCNDTHWRCSQGDCIPLRWLCDGYADCPLGDDEFRCRAGPDGYLPHPARSDQLVPQWIRNIVDKPNANSVYEAAESRVAPTQLLRSGLEEEQRPVEQRRQQIIRGDSDELLMTSDSGSPARPYPKYNRSRPFKDNRRPPTTPPALATPSTEAEPVPEAPVDTKVKAAKEKDVSPEDEKVFRELLSDLEKYVDSEKWWEQQVGEAAEDAAARAVQGALGSISSHASPCPSGELRCVDGRCIAYAQLCDGHVDCTDSADEQNCQA